MFSSVYTKTIQTIETVSLLYVSCFLFFFLANTNTKTMLRYRKRKSNIAIPSLLLSQMDFQHTKEFRKLKQPFCIKLIFQSFPPIDNLHYVKLSYKKLFGTFNHNRFYYKSIKKCKKWNKIKLFTFNVFFFWLIKSL